MFASLDEKAILPSRARDTDAGIDLFFSERVYLPPETTSSVTIPVQLQLPKASLFGLVVGRSKYPVLWPIFVFPGVVDYSYRGALKVVVRNFGKNFIQFERGDSIAQLLILQVSQEVSQAIAIPQPYSELRGVDKNHNKII